MALPPVDHSDRNKWGPKLLAWIQWLFDQAPSQQEVDDLRQDVTNAEGDIDALQNDVGQLQTDITSKADQSDLDATNLVVAGKVDQGDFDALEITVGGKADQSSLDALDSRVDVSLNTDGTLVASEVEDAMVVGGLATPTTGEWGAIQTATTLANTREYDVRQWGTPTGLGADVTFINQAIADIYSWGGGTLVFPDVSTGYGVQRVGGVQMTGIMPKPGVSLRSLGATFHMRDNCAFVMVQSQATVNATISANVAIGDTSFTVSDATGLVVGKTVLLRLNTRAGDTPEPMWWTYATITSIVGNVVTLDTPAGVACNVATTTEAHNKRIQMFDELIDGIGIYGTWNLVNAMGGSGGENAEGGVKIQYARNITVDSIVGTNTGAGVVTCQFATNVAIAEIRGPAIAKQGGASSKGRVLTVAECVNVRVGTVDYDKAEGDAAIMVEHVSRGVVIDTIRHTNRSLDATRRVIHMAYDSECYVERLESSGIPEGICSGSPDQQRLKIGTLHINHTGLPSGLGVLPSGVRDAIVVNGVRYGPMRTITTRLAITPSMSDVQPVAIPEGFVAGLWITLKDKTDTATWYLVNTSGTANINTASMTVNVPYFVPLSDSWGATTGYGHTDYRYVKTLHIYTGPGVVADNMAEITYNVFPLASANLPNRVVG